MTRTLLGFAAVVSLFGCAHDVAPAPDATGGPTGKADDERAGFVASREAVYVDDAFYEAGTYDGYEAIRTTDARGESLLYVEIEPARDFDSALGACASFGDGRFELQREADFLFPIILGYSFERIEVTVDRGVADGVRHTYPAWLQGDQGNDDLLGTDLVGSMSDGEGTYLRRDSLATLLADVRESLAALRNGEGGDLSEEDATRERAFLLRAESVFSEGLAPVCVARP